MGQWLGYLLALLFWIGYPLAIEGMAPHYPCEGRSRSRAQVRSFMRQHPCPAGPDRGSRVRCRGYEVDHVIPLACCGRDDPSNMQWLTAWENRRKGASACRTSLPDAPAREDGAWVLRQKSTYRASGSVFGAENHVPSFPTSHDHQDRHPLRLLSDHQDR